MTPDKITLRSRAIRFFGLEEYKNLHDAAQAYLTRNAFPIPPTGVEDMTEYWEVIQTLMEDVSRSKQ